MKRRLIAALLAMAGIIATPSVSYADNVPGHLDLTVHHGSDGSAYATLTTGWGVGDCTLLPGSSVNLKPPNTRGFSTFEWTAWGSTEQTKNGDIWHQTATFLTPSGTIVATSSTLDGPKMFPDGQVFWTRAQDVRSTSSILTISKVRLDARC